MPWSFSWYSPLVSAKWGHVYLIVAQYAKGEGLALQDDVVRVAVASDGDGDARGAFRGLHHPRRCHRVRLAAPAGAKHVYAVGKVT